MPPTTKKLGRGSRRSDREKQEKKLDTQQSDIIMSYQVLSLNTYTKNNVIQLIGVFIESRFKAERAKGEFAMYRHRASALASPR
jgi:hypothetical protein